jgi:hypothetical protein
MTMLNPQKYQIQFADGREEEVTVDGRDYMFYERESGESALDLISKGNSFEVWYTSAAAAMRRQGRWEGTPEEFYDVVVYVLPVRNGGEPEDPTSPTGESESSA